VAVGVVTDLPRLRGCGSRRTWAMGVTELNQYAKDTVRYLGGAICGGQ
jgi:hypothetical protein